MDSAKGNNLNSIIDCPGNEVMDLTHETEPKYMVNKPQRKIPKKIIFIIAILLVLIALLSTVFALGNMHNEKILNGISVRGINVSKLTKEEAVAKLQEELGVALEKEITLQYGEYEALFTANQVEAKYNIEKAVNDAYNIGRNGNIITNNYTILFANFSKKDIPIEFLYHKEAMQKLLDKVESKIPGKVQEPTYCIEDEELIITNGKSGISIRRDELSNRLINAFENRDTSTIQIPVQILEPQAINIDNIYEDVHKEAKDAYYTKDPFEIHAHVVGVDFDISLDEAKQLLEENKEEYKIPLKFTTPKVTTDKIGTEAFPDLLSSFSTTYITSKVNRTTNLKLAAAKINGYIVMPGEVFSYNKVVGKRTVEAGYKEAGVYSGGEVVDGLGGGICQISSNLYDLVLYANLGIVERHNHQFLPGYVGAGKDATVVYGALDFKFKNTRKYPVRIQASVGGGYVRMKLYGIKEEIEYDVSIQSEILQTIYPKTVYKDTSKLAEGKTKVEDRGQNGCKSRTYKILKKDGKVVSKTLLSTDTYDAMKKVVLRGTKKTSGSSGGTSSNTNTNTNTSTNTNTNTSTNTNTNMNTSENQINSNNTTENNTVNNVTA